jgi:hypothetical protein
MLRARRVSSLRTRRMESLMQRVGVEKMTEAKSFRRILLEEKGLEFRVKSFLGRSLEALEEFNTTRVR